MDVKTTALNNRIVDIIDESKFQTDWSMYQNQSSLTESTAVELTVGNEEYVLPFRSKTDDRPGIYQDGCIYFVQTGDEFKKENLDIIDFSNTKSIQDFMEKNSQIRQMEENILTDVDSVFAPRIDPNDQPAMKAFKEAICNKKIDINKYASRFGDNFLNDKRILKTGNITLGKLVSMGNYLDMRMSLVIEDKNPKVPNPIGKTITVTLTDEEDK